MNGPTCARRWCGVIVRLAALGALAGWSGVRAAPQQRDLGDQMTYVRLYALPGDLPAEPALQDRAAIIDLRFARADTAAAEVFRGWLRFHARPNRRLFILVNAETSAPLQQALRDRAGLPGVLTVARSGQRADPDITVPASAEEEREAYDAFEAGAAIHALTTDHPDKPRNDEASLTRPHDGSDSDDGPPPAGDTPPKKPVLDPVLQRAVQIQRGLRALKTP